MQHNYCIVPVATPPKNWPEAEMSYFIKLHFKKYNFLHNSGSCNIFFKKRRMIENIFQNNCAYLKI